MRRDLCLAADELASTISPSPSLPLRSLSLMMKNKHSESIKDKLNIISYDDEMEDDDNEEEEEFVLMKLKLI